MIACIIIQLSILISCIILVSRYILHYIMIFWLQIHLAYHVYINQCSFNMAHKTRISGAGYVRLTSRGARWTAMILDKSTDHSSSNFNLRNWGSEFMLQIVYAILYIWISSPSYASCISKFRVTPYTQIHCAQKQPPVKHPLLSVVWATIQGEHQPSWSGVDQTRSLWTRRRVRSGSKRVA